MKKTVSISLLFCLLLTIVGHHIVFRIQRSAVRTEMKKFIHSSSKTDDQEIFVFDLNDNASLSKLEWGENNEFRLAGKMYDVIEQKTENGKLVIRCISDEKETALIKKYEKINKDAGSHSKNKTAFLIKLITAPYVAVINPGLPPAIDAPIQNNFAITNILSSDRSDVLTPPPQLG